MVKEFVNGMSADLSVVVPTFNEYENIPLIIESVSGALDGVEWELIIVDDNSPDETADRVKHFAKKDPRIRCIRRVNRRGLSSASMEGILASSATCVAVMDADLQHDESLLKDMYEKIIGDEADIIIGSRYISQGSTGEGLSKFRVFVSKVATLLGRTILKTNVSDPMSGYFMIRRESFEHQMDQLSGRGFKILLDLLASVPDSTRILELPYVMRQRETGESKLDAMVVSEYYVLILDKLVGRYIPVRFLMFVTVGLFGVLVHAAILTLVHKNMGLDFPIAQIIGTIVAMTSNFLINNRFTYRDMRLTGNGFWYGLFSFYLACSVGALVNIQLSSFMFSNGVYWLLAGITGAFVGAIWNYAMTATFTWRKHSK